MMASFSKMARASIPSQIYTTFSMISPLYKNLGSRLYSKSSPPCCPCAGDYDSRKLGHKLSVGGVKPDFDTIQDIPSGVFRNTKGEILGLGAGKNKYYRNPEYFSFHHMSFYDINMCLSQYRSPAPKTGRKPN